MASFSPRSAAQVGGTLRAISRLADWRGGPSMGRMVGAEFFSAFLGPRRPGSPGAGGAAARRWAEG